MYIFTLICLQRPVKQNILGNYIATLESKKAIIFYTI